MVVRIPDVRVISAPADGSRPYPVPSVTVVPPVDARRVLETAYLVNGSGSVVEYQRRLGSPSTWWHRVGEVMQVRSVTAYGVTVGVCAERSLPPGARVWHVTVPPGTVMVSDEVEVTRLTEGPSVLRHESMHRLPVPKRSMRTKFRPGATGGI